MSNGPHSQRHRVSGEACCGGSGGTVKIYVAASSREPSRARAFADALEIARGER